jgi:flagellar biosynthesis/type III secretory pathway protein FliH
MSPEVMRELEAEMKAYGLARGETEEERERQRQAAKLMLLMVPEVSEELRHQGETVGHDAGLREGRDAGLREGRDAGLREGRDAGLREGREEALRVARQAILDLCEVLGLAVTEAQRADLQARDLAGLDALRTHLKTHRAWP